MTQRILNAAVVALGIGGASLSPSVVAQEPCATPTTVHIPIETAKEPLGLRGEMRADYLNRRYGAGRWRAAEGLVSLTPAADGAKALQLRLPAQAGVRFERVDIVAEAQLDYLEASGRPSRRYGHREIGSYPLVADAGGELTVPLDVMRESGELLAIVTLRRAPDFAAPEVHVAAAAAQRPGCERRIYVPDRASAIRLNRPGH